MEYKDYYETLGVPGRRARPTSRRPSASSPASTTPTCNPGDAAAEQRFKEINEANEVLVRSREARSATTARRELGGLRRAPAPAGDPFGAGRAVRRVRRAARRGRPGRHPLRVPHDRRRRPASATSSGPSSAAAAAGATATGGRASRRGPPARPGGPRSTTSWPGWASARRRRSAPTRRRPAAGTASRPRPRSPSRRRSTAPPGCVEIDGKRLEVKIPRGVDDRQPDPAAPARDPAGADRRRRRPGRAAPGLHPPRRRPRARAAGDARGGAARRGGPGRDAQGPGPADRSPPGTQNGERIRLTGQGMPALRGDEPGRPLRPDPRRPADRPVDEAKAARAASARRQPDPRAARTPRSPPGRQPRRRADGHWCHAWPAS